MTTPTEPEGDRPGKISTPARVRHKVFTQGVII
jgi:hypothetical protein